MIALLSENEGICMDGKWKGWVMRRHVDGHWFSVRMLDEADPMEGNPLAAMFTAATPAPASHLVVTDELATTYKAAFRAVFDRRLNDETGIPQENIGLIATKAGLQAVFDALTTEGQP